MRPADFPTARPRERMSVHKGGAREAFLLPHYANQRVFSQAFDLTIKLKIIQGKHQDDCEADEVPASGSKFKKVPEKLSKIHSILTHYLKKESLFKNCQRFK